MRITNSIVARNALAGIRNGMTGLDQAQARVASGLRFQRPSDDPAAAADVMSADRRLAALGQYQRNISASRARLSAQESALADLDGILVRARELAVGQAGSTASPATRQVAAAEMERLHEAAVQLANTRFGSGYLFGGDYAHLAPVPDGGATHDPTGSRPIEVAEGHTLDTVLDARRLFLDSGVLDSLRQLADALAGNDLAAIRSGLSDVTLAADDVQVSLGETGARAQQLEMAESNAAALELSLREYRSDLTEIDLEEAATAMLARQNALQAALMTTSRIMNLTLADYLR